MSAVRKRHKGRAGRAKFVEPATCREANPGLTLVWVGAGRGKGLGLRSAGAGCVDMRRVYFMTCLMALFEFPRQLADDIRIPVPAV